MNAPTPSEWVRLQSRELLHTRVFDVRASEFRHPAREEGKEFLVIDAPDWAVVAPVTTGGELVLVRQFRFGAQQLSLELPGGVIEHGEDPARAAVRELVEETGYRGGEAEVLGWVHPNPAIQSNRAHLIVVPDVQLADSTDWDADEELSLTLAPIDDILAMGRSGQITHALMLNMLFLLEPWWKQRARERGAI
ncbi:NUDIX hydrolase [Opitutaceae bacterium]|nr:NUDIX hydrolase [Opitutaceae bacterium]